MVLRNFRIVLYELHLGSSLHVIAKIKAYKFFLFLIHEAA